MSAQILAVKPGTVSEADKIRLNAAGVVVIEHRSPNSLRLLRAESLLDGDDLLACAMHALRQGGYASSSTQADFTQAVSRAVLAKKGKA